jgi:lipid-A-disaccharide synthase
MTEAPLKVLMAAGEVSGDMYGGALIRALRKQYPGRTIEVRGMGGDAMKAEGATLLHHTDALGAMGIFEVLAKIRYFKQVMKDMVSLAETWKPDVLITLDYYSFNIALAEKVKALGVRTVHYISPRVWV